jgi:NAD(P)-dependent dehydrogenase (short-subunit alcohol dehydrogenase family)
VEVNICEKLFGLAGKTAMITGGYKGIGLVFAKTYAEAGADVAIVARNGDGCRLAAREISRQYNVRATGIPMDVRNSDEVRRVVEQIVTKFGKVDILVNSAGIAGIQKPVSELTDSNIDDVMNVDFKGVYVTSREVARHMAKRRRGRIISIASVLGQIVARNMAGYCSSKAAAIQLTKVMALELIRENIQVNALCPGYFRTALNSEFFDSEPGKKMIKKMIPINRAGDLEELRSTALYLATAPAFLTGAVLNIDGGHTLT